jgi:uncharacterized membrane protein
MQEYNVKEAVSFGWTKLESNFGFLFILLAVSILINIPLGIIDCFVSESLANILGIIISTIISIGFIKIALMLHDNEKGSISDLFSHYPLFFKSFFGSILYTLIVLAGLILFIIPGIIWAIKFSFYQYFIVDQECGSLEALKRSAAITDGYKWQLFQLGLLLVVINLIGMLCLFVGLLATIPLSMIAMAYTYRKLLAKLEGEKTGTILNPQVTNPA